MSKRTLGLLIFSVVVVFIWIGYTVYANLFITNTKPNDADLAKYDIVVGTNLHPDILTKLNNLSSNVKVPLSELTQGNQ